MKLKHIGIDFGAKKAGTTVICYSGNEGLVLNQSNKNSDADSFISSFLHENDVEYVFIDAPLSLPKAFFDNENYSDYFYRKCDRDAQAMSPMFLGGLTARAIKLKDTFSQQNFIEIYPKMTSKKLFGNDYKNLHIIELEKILVENGIFVASEINNFHQIDSILAWHAGKLFLENEADKLGDDEGYIFY